MIKQDFINNNNNYAINKFNFNESEFIDLEVYKNLKLYYLVKEEKDQGFTFEKANIRSEQNNKRENENELFCFDFVESNFKKNNFKIDNEKIDRISKLYEKIIKQNFGYLEKSAINEINELFKDKCLIDYFEEGFKKYIFDNNKKDYFILKEILFLYIYTFQEHDTKWNSHINNLKNNIKIIMKLII